MIVFYFSGTGNTKYAAKHFAKGMGCDCISIEAQADFTALLTQHRTLAFFYPVYGSDVPMIMREFVNAHLKALSGKRLIIFCTQMMFSGDGSRVFTDLLKGIDYQVIYARHLNMPNNISNLWVLPVKNHPAIDRQLLKVKRRIHQDVKAIRSGRVRKEGFNPISKGLGYLGQRSYFGPIERKAQKDVRVQETCIQCGLCVRICPMDNLTLEASGVQQNGRCTLCYRCVNRCPKGAITVLLHAPVKRPYKGIKESRR